MTVIHVPPAMLPSSGSMWKLRQGTINKWEKHCFWRSDSIHHLPRCYAAKLNIHQNLQKGLTKQRLLGPTLEFLIQYVWDRAQDSTLLTRYCWSRDHTFRTPIWRKVLTDSLILGNQKPSVHQNNPEFLLPLERASRSPLVPNSSHNSSYLSFSLFNKAVVFNCKVTTYFLYFHFPEKRRNFEMLS